MKHTPTPWQHRATPVGWDGVYADTQLIAQLALNVPENAAFIVRAVNSHEALLALANRVAALNPDAGEIGAGMLVQLVTEAREAVTAAEGKA